MVLVNLALSNSRLLLSKESGSGELFRSITSLRLPELLAKRTLLTLCIHFMIYDLILLQILYNTGDNVSHLSAKSVFCKADQRFMEEDSFFSNTLVLSSRMTRN